MKLRQMYKWYDAIREVTEAEHTKRGVSEAFDFYEAWLSAIEGAIDSVQYDYTESQSCPDCGVSSQYKCAGTHS